MGINFSSQGNRQLQLDLDREKTKREIEKQITQRLLEEEKTKQKRIELDIEKEKTKQIQFSIAQDVKDVPPEKQGGGQKLQRFEGQGGAKKLV